jgi:hypothetical protein
MLGIDAEKIGKFKCGIKILISISGITLDKYVTGGTLVEFL